MQYNQNTDVTLGDMLTFVIVSSILGSAGGSNIGYLIGRRIESGTITLDLIRPVTLKSLVFAECAGETLFRFLFTALPPCLIAGLFYGIEVPRSIFTIVFTVGSASIGVLISYHFNYLLGLSAFWTKASFHVQWVERACMLLFGGAFIPLWFYPESLYESSKILPFRLISFEVINILLLKYTALEAVQVVALQIGWLIALVMLGKIIWRSASATAMAQGG